MKMSRNLKIKITAIVVVALASVAVMGVLLFNMQNALTQDNYAAEMVAETGQLDTLLADAASEADQDKETFDAIYQSKAQSIAFMADNDTGYEAADAKMREYRELLGVDNVLIVRRDGSVVRLHRRRGRGRPVRHLRPARRRAPRRGGAGRCEGGRPAINRRIAKKAAVLSAVGSIGIIVISFYMQTPFALSSQSLAMTERVEQIAQTIKTSQDRASDLEDQYNERYLSKAQVAAYILDRNPEPATREKLQELADALQIEYPFTFDSSGRVTATSSTFTNFVLSEDPEDQSYGFRKLMQGVESYVQPAGPVEVSGELRQYIGVVTHDTDGVIDGFVQLGIRPTRLETLLEPVQIDHVLDGVRVGADGALMAERVPLTVATAGIALVCLAVIFCLMVVEPKPGADAAWRRATHIGAQALDEKRPGRLSLPGASRYPHTVCVREILEAVATMVAAEAAASTAIAAEAAAVVSAAARTAVAVVVEAHGDERLDDLVEHLDDLLGGIGGEGRDELLALVAHGLGELLGILAREDDDLAHVLLLGIDARDDVVLLGLDHEGVELAQAHAHELGHLLLLHLGLELEQLEGAHEVAQARGVLVGLVTQHVAAGAQQAGGAVHLVEQLVVQVLRGDGGSLVDGLGIVRGLDGPIGLGLLDLDGLVGGLGLHVLGLHGDLDGLRLVSRLDGGLVDLGHLLVQLAVLRHAFLLRPRRSSGGSPNRPQFT